MKPQRGFTIIELLIATSVFSIVLVALTVGIISFSRAYYKGVTASTTQSTARNVLEDITQSIQFSGLKAQPLAPYPTSVANKYKSYGFCVGSTLYSYLPGWQLESATSDAAYQTKYAFIRSTPANGCADNGTVTPQDLYKGIGITGTELLAPHMRVSQASLTPNVNGDARLYHFDLRIVYGDADLLTDPYGPNANCANGLPGTQFCAVSQLASTVQRRVN